MNNKREELFGEKVMCEYCGKALKTFRTKFDWKQRKMHKKCYFIKLEEDRIRWIIEETVKREREEEARMAQYKAENEKLRKEIQYRKDFDMKRMALNCGVYDL
jgi:hypothetical protein